MSGPHILGPRDLLAGQWVDLWGDGREQGPFCVINRTDSVLDNCRCHLIDGNGKLHTYSARNATLDSILLPHDYKFVRLEDETAKKLMGAIFELYTKVWKKVEADKCFPTLTPEGHINWEIFKV